MAGEENYEETKKTSLSDRVLFAEQTLPGKDYAQVKNCCAMLLYIFLHKFHTSSMLPIIFIFMLLDSPPHLTIHVGDV